MSESILVVSPVAVEIFTAVFASLKHLQYAMQRHQRHQHHRIDITVTWQLGYTVPLKIPILSMRGIMFITF